MSANAISQFLTEIPIAMAMFDTQMRYVCHTQGWLDMYGIKQRDVKGISHYELFPEIPEHWRKLHQETLAGKTLSRQRELFRRADGSIQYISWSMKPWFDDAHNIAGLILQTEDVTQSVELEEKHDTTSSILDRLERVSGIGHWRVDLAEQQVLWSAQTCVIHELPIGHKVKLAEGINFYKPGIDRDTIIKAVDAAIANGTPWDLELQIVTAKGNVRWVRAIGEALFVKNKCVQLFGTFQDITDIVEYRAELIKQRENAELLLLERSHLLAKISHELRTPLNGIVGMLQSLEYEKDHDKRMNNLGLALQSAKMLMRLINDVLDYSKISREDIPFEYQTFSIKQFITDIAQVYEPLAHQKNIQFSHDIMLQGGDDAEWVYFDSVRLGQIITNLLNNAVKFTQQGKVSLMVSVAEGAIARHCKIVVSDTGVGMSEDDLANLFTPFTQVGKNKYSVFGGTGLGLSIVKQLIDRMGGTITVKSEQEVGSKFIVDLDLLKATPPELSVDDIPDNIDGSNLRILIVDDVSINISVLEALLTQFNIHNTEHAFNGMECLELCQTNEYDVIFMDINMPVLDGIEATRRLKSNPTFPTHTQIIAVTAVTGDEAKQQLMDVNIDGYVSKPIKISELAPYIMRSIV